MIKFTEREVIDVYNTHVRKDRQYLFKAQNGLKGLTSGELDYWRGKDVPRLASIIDFKDYIDKYKLRNIENILSTDASDPELFYFPASNVHVATYHHGSNDLHSLDLPKKDFDMIIFNQTIEHLYNPFLSMKNLYDHLAPGGFLYTTVPIINIPHMVPFHFWGVTPTGLCMLSKSAGFSIQECGWWGNKKYIDYLFSNNDWPDFEKLDSDLINDEVCQAQTWILLKK